MQKGIPLALSIAAMFLAAFAVLSQRAPNPPAPVYGWKEVSRTPFPSPLPPTAALLFRQGTSGKTRFALETEDAGATVALTSSSWECIANCSSSENTRRNEQQQQNPYADYLQRRIPRKQKEQSNK